MHSQLHLKLLILISSSATRGWKVKVYGYKSNDCDVQQIFTVVLKCLSVNIGVSVPHLKSDFHFFNLSLPRWNRLHSRRHRGDPLSR